VHHEPQGKILTKGKGGSINTESDRRHLLFYCFDRDLFTAAVIRVVKRYMGRRRKRIYNVENCREMYSVPSFDTVKIRGLIESWKIQEISECEYPGTCYKPVNCQLSFSQYSRQVLGIHCIFRPAAVDWIFAFSRRKGDDLFIFAAVTFF
jgi:hypothetical protein